MVVRMMGAVLAVSALVVACSGGDGNSNEGSTCVRADDCGGNLSCQPIQGRQGNFCCPTPPESSKESNCQPGK